jgi:hypothetical protein
MKQSQPVLRAVGREKGTHDGLGCFRGVAHVLRLYMWLALAGALMWVLSLLAR